MFSKACFAIVLFISAGAASAQSPATPSPSPLSPRAPGAQRPQAPEQTRPAAPFELSEYGVSVAPDARLVIVMAALDAAGFDPTPAGKEPSPFRLLVRKDQANLDAGLRERLKAFFDRNKLPAPATAADQAARYVSLAYALGAPPLLDAPDRSEDLPSRHSRSARLCAAGARVLQEVGHRRAFGFIHARIPGGRRSPATARGRDGARSPVLPAHAADRGVD